MNRNERLARVLPLLLILFPYSFVFLKSLSIAYIIVIWVVIDLILFALINKVKVNLAPIILVFILFMISMIALTFSEMFSVAFVVQDFFKFMIWGLLLMLVSSRPTDLDKVVRCMVSVTFVACVYLLLQNAFYVLVSVRLPNVWNFGLISHTTLDMRTVVNFRAASFYSEPSYLSTQIIVTLGLLSFTNIKFNHKKGLIIFFFVCNLLSTSTTGIYISFLYLFLTLFKNKKNKLKIYLLIMFSVVVAVLYVSNQTLIHDFIGTYVSKSLKQSLEKIQYIDSLSRLGGSFSYLENVEGFHVLIGYGIGNEYAHIGFQTYINSVTRIIIQTGYLGFSCFIMFFLLIIKKAQKKILLLYLLMIYGLVSFTGGAMFSITGMFILSLFYLFVNQGEEMMTL